MLAPMDELCRFGRSLVDLTFENKKGSNGADWKCQGLKDKWPGSWNLSWLTEGLAYLYGKMPGNGERPRSCSAAHGFPWGCLCLDAHNITVVSHTHTPPLIISLQEAESFSVLSEYKSPDFSNNISDAITISPRDGCPNYHQGHWKEGC